MTTLRYWDCQGRGEPLRMMLEDWEVPYTNEVIPLEQEAEWEERRNYSSFAGPFGQLPVLEFVEPEELRTVVQTPAIAQYIALKADPAWLSKPPSVAELTKTLAYGNMAYEDLMVPLLKCIFNTSMAVKTIGNGVPRVLERVEEILSVVQEDVTGAFAAGTLSEEDSVYLLGPLPAYPDYLLFHAISVLKDIGVASPIFKMFPNVEAHFTSMQQRPNLASYLTSGRRPQRITSCKTEAKNKRVIVDALQAVGFFDAAGN
ncbi:hypothetical protein CYMTET_18505 [Cymbomonas tetramitiformis]|uniref:Glutathione transferase n=1 Tax=Cymbomonas tetramitiformis TaxID=36881 RepID=A0AAE0L691_9CHLO|nr:hypothetical protein CYMTET_18505 [Cymbomonas tetramitiformis]